MKKNKKQTKTQRSGKRNLTVINQGDTVVIRNRSAVAASLLGVIMLGVSAAGVFTLREAWELPLFWLTFGLLIAGTVYSFAKMLFAKVVLDSPKMTITVYNPTPVSYKFEDVNYVDVKTVRGADGTEMHVVTTYIADGKRSVELVSYSKKQADEIAALMRGMLDNTYITEPEYEAGEDASEGDGEVEFNFIKRQKKTNDESVDLPKEEDEKPQKEDENAERENDENE